MQLNLGATYGNRFFNNKFGIMAALSYQNSPAGSDNCEYTYDLDDKGNVVLTDADIRQYYVTRERQSYSLSMDYDFNTNNKIYFNGIYNRRNDWENRYALSFKGLADGAGQMSVKSQLKMGSADDRKHGVSCSRPWTSPLEVSICYGIVCIPTGRPLSHVRVRTSPINAISP